MTRRRFLLWWMLLGGWWLGVIFGRMSEEMDLGWWDTVFLFAVGALTLWIVVGVKKDVIDREESAR